MKTKKIFHIVLCCILIITSMPFISSAVNEYKNMEYNQNEIVITTEHAIIDTSTTFITYNTTDYTLIDFNKEEINSIEQLDTYNVNSDEKTYVVEVEGNINEKCKELENLPGVKYAEPNIIFHSTQFTMPDEINNSNVFKQHMKWYYDLMQIPETWQKFKSTGEGVIVAVIDNGFNLNATDFPENLWTDENGNHGWNTYKNSADISPIYKSDGTEFKHTGNGTHIAGIIAAPANGKSLVGAAFNSQLMLINAAHYKNDLEEPQYQLDDIIEAIEYARCNGADIINMSFGAVGTSNILEKVINSAYEDGIALFAPAGNYGRSIYDVKVMPACYENVIGVMSSDKDNPTQLLSYSDYDPTGNFYDVVAPGYQIVGCSSINGTAAAKSGTGHSTALISACAALYLSVYPNSTVSELYDAIKNSSVSYVTANPDTAPGDGTKYKLLSALKLLEYGMIKPDVCFNSDTNVRVDDSLSYIFGFDVGFKDIANYISVNEGYYELVQCKNGIGTGSVINIYDIYGDLYKTYTIIVFGDINGDTTVDGQDAVIISCVMNFTDKFTDAQKFASDVDFDGQITENDYRIAADTALFLDFISQIK